jgi:hypothetical protein
MDEELKEILLSPMIALPVIGLLICALLALVKVLM